MKIGAVIVILFSIFFGSQKDTEALEWREGERLHWKCFKGVPDEVTAYVASTNSGISFSYGMKSSHGVIEINYEIKTYFYPKASWYKRGKVNDYILAHEQAHFDVSELFARKLKKELAALSEAETFKEAAGAMYKKNEQERIVFQNKFDKETDHSKNFEKEKEWRVFIVAQLKEYNDWRK